MPRSLTSDSQPNLPLTLWLAVASGQRRWLWSTQVGPSDALSETRSPHPTEAPGQPQWLTDEPGQRILESVMGVPCQVGLVATVPPSLVIQMSAWMHVTLAAHLRAQGDLAGARVLEQAWTHQHRPARKGPSRA